MTWAPLSSLLTDFWRWLGSDPHKSSQICSCIWHDAGSSQTTLHHHTMYPEIAIMISIVSVNYCSMHTFEDAKKKKRKKKESFHPWLSTNLILSSLSLTYIVQTSLIKVGVNPSLKKEMWLLMYLITKKTCTKMYKSIHFWNQKSQMNPMVATDFCKIMQFSRNSSVTMVTIEFFLDSITKIWFY